MKLFPAETFLTYKFKLKNNIVYIQYWDLNYHWRPDCIGHFITLWKKIFLPLRSPLVLISPPRIKWLYEKRELANIITDEMNKKRLFLYRIWQKLEHEIKKAIRGDIYYPKVPAQSQDENSEIWKLRKLIVLLRHFFGGEGV